MKAGCNGIEVEIRSFRDLTDEEMVDATCIKLSLDMDDEKLRSRYCLVHANHVIDGLHVAFLIPKQIEELLTEAITDKIKGNVRAALDRI